MNTSELKYTGGARIGFVNATWPLAHLNVSADKILLKASWIGSYEFTRDQVIGIEKYGIIPFLGWGIKIEHNVEAYPSKIIFWVLGNPNKLISEIQRVGFLPRGQEDTQNLPKRKGLPVKVLPLVVAVVLWNILILVDQKFLINQVPLKPGILSLVALLLIFSLSLAIKKSKALANIFLKPDRTIGEITPVLNLLIIITGIMLMISLFFIIQFGINR